MKVGFVSLGCSKNLVDSENIMGVINSLGHSLVSNVNEAEAIFINTCGFITPAKEEAINTILEMADYKDNNCQKLVVLGCLVERYKAELVEEFPEVDLFISIQEYPDLKELLIEVLGDISEEDITPTRVISTKPWYAYLKISDGCSNRCSFCAIPFIRGGLVSKPLEELVSEATHLAKQGVKELVVIAQDTTQYGLDIYQSRSLLELLKQLNNIEGIHWIRVLYMYPDEIDEELLYGMKELDKVLPYFDIPMQHGSDKLLKTMRRRGTIAEISERIELIKKIFPRPVLRTTMIVGYPGEDEEDFNALINFVKEVKWHRLGAFKFSKEEDTPAYDLEETVSETLKEERYHQLMTLQQSISLQLNQELIGETLEVLIESYDSLKDVYRGRSIYSAPDEVDGIVYVKSSKELIFGSFYEVEITDADVYDLKGVIR